MSVPRFIYISFKACTPLVLITIYHWILYRSGDDDVHIDIDNIDDTESVRDALWEENSTASSPAGSTVSSGSMPIKTIFWPLMYQIKISPEKHF